MNGDNNGENVQGEPGTPGVNTQSNKRRLDSPAATGVTPPYARARIDPDAADNFLELLLDPRIKQAFEQIFAGVISSIVNRQDELDLKVCSQENVISDLNGKVSKAESKIDQLKLKIDQMEKSLKEKSNELQELAEAYDDLEQYGRRMSLRVYGIKESASVNDDREDTDKAVLDLCNDKLGANLTLNDIQRSHQTGPKGTNSAIIFRFLSYRTRALVWRSRFRLKGTNIFLSEDLTKRRNKLAYKACQLKRDKIIADTYTTDGKVMIKPLRGPNDPMPKPVEVIRMADLEKYCQRDRP